MSLSSLRGLLSAQPSCGQLEVLPLHILHKCVFLHDKSYYSVPTCTLHPFSRAEYTLFHMVHHKGAATVKEGGHYEHPMVQIQHLF